MMEAETGLMNLEAKKWQVLGCLAGSVGEHATLHLGVVGSGPHGVWRLLKTNIKRRKKEREEGRKEGRMAVARNDQKLEEARKRPPQSLQRKYGPANTLF